jgi:serine-type D-Ala-D-Ala carboxypeptidase/endopeptidase (penicillin-binding protein 4)
MRLFGYIWIFLFFLTGCATYRPIHRELLRHPALADHFTGFALYDWESQKMLVEHNADRYFTPASNTKLFSFYAGLTALKDSIPAFRAMARF